MIYIKSNREIDKIKKACKVVAGVLELVQKNIKPGVSTYELNLIAEDYIYSKNGRPAFKDYTVSGLPPFPSGLCTSVNSCIVHGIPSSQKVLNEGDIISIDVGVELDNYFGDAAVTCGVGKISKENEDLLKITKEALDKGIYFAKIGNSIGDISNAIGEYIVENGYYVAEQLTGHGVGKQLHEEPMIPNEGIKAIGHKIKKNMTLALEPMVSIGTSKVKAKEWEYFTANGKNSAHFEHTILITDSNPEILTLI
ncbi:MAG: type I methionyl aminopeptidase [Candidatus Cloacimonetes bacterium]|nr:type I methionyl aminopeptidase [Candidatus Cloacimonadota bacterium]MDD4155409.1 type I methionyl aminopeptidase [Candidatus Cloacimonadota bacterium]